jgi:hypothetical protein
LKVFAYSNDKAIAATATTIRDHPKSYDSSARVYPTSEHAVAWPLRSVAAVHATKINVQHSPLASEKKWDAEYRVEIGDHSVELPTWERPHTESGRQDIQSVVNAILAGMA